jgi:hypothetical protein
MKRMIFRISRGRAIPQFFELGLVNYFFYVECEYDEEDFYCVFPR